MVFMPESPVYLIERGKEDEAKKALQWLRKTENVEAELKAKIESHHEQEEVGQVGLIGIFTNRIYFEPWLIMILLMFFQQFSGVNAVLFYLKV